MKAIIADPWEFGDLDHEWDHRTGRPGIGLFSDALQVWAVLQERRVSVAEAAAAFKVPGAAIVRAVENHYWMDLTGPRDDYARLMIEHEGE